MRLIIKIVFYNGIKRTFKNIFYFEAKDDMLHIMTSDFNKYSFFTNEIKKITIYRK